MDKTTMYAYISFTGNDDVYDFPLEDVTEQLNVQPTRTWKAGDRVNEVTSRLHFFTCWKYESKTLETLDSDDVLLPILNAFNSKIDTINQLKQQLNLYVKIYIVISMFDGQSPGLYISPEFSRFAGTIDAMIGIDMYVYPFAESEE